MIRSTRVILCRTLLGVLDSRRVNIFAVSEATRIPIPELRRLVEFASPLDRDSAERLVGWAMKMTIVTKPKTRASSAPATQARRNVHIHTA